VRLAKPEELRKPARLAKRFPLEEEYRARIAKATKLKGDELVGLISNLEVLAAGYQDHTSEWAKRVAATAAKCYYDIAEALNKLASLANDPLEARELRIRALCASVDADLHKVKPRRRKKPDRRRGLQKDPDPPRSRGADLDCRNWLARETRKTIERHCGKLKPADLREAVVAVLEATGATFPDPDAQPSKFDAMMSGGVDQTMMRTRPQEPSEGQREEQLERERRLDGRSI
jgi:hypothetical protein